MFAYIVEEARGANSNFKNFFCSPLGWLSGTASLKYTDGTTLLYLEPHIQIVNHESNLPTPVL